MTRVASPIDATMHIMELVQMAPNVSTMGLVDFLISVRIGMSWWLPRVDNVVASRPP